MAALPTKLVQTGASVSGRESDVINASVPLLSHDYLHHLYLRDVMGRRGLVVVGVGKSGELGFQILYRFSDICDRLEACGVNVYPRESARHVQEAISLSGARYRDSGQACFWMTTVSSLSARLNRNRFA